MGGGIAGGQGCRKADVRAFFVRPVETSSAEGGSLADSDGVVSIALGGRALFESSASSADTQAVFAPSARPVAGVSVAGGSAEMVSTADASVATCLTCSALMPSIAGCREARMAAGMSCPIATTTTALSDVEAACPADGIGSCITGASILDEAALCSDGTSAPMDFSFACGDFVSTAGEGAENLALFSGMEAASETHAGREAADVSACSGSAKGDGARAAEALLSKAFGSDNARFNFTISGGL